MKEIIESIAKNAQQANAEPTDYLNESDSLMYCGKCHTPKQFKLKEPYAEGKDLVYTLCKCRAEEKAEEDRRAELSKHLQLVERLRSQGIRDKKILEWTFANDDGTTPSMDKAKRYVEQFEQLRAENIGLLLWGNVGTGKSYFAGCIANALIEKEIPVAMTNFGVILADMMNLQIDKNEYIQSLNRKSLLIIDDFGMERNTPFALEQVYNVIDSRYTASKPLIVTTNLTLSEMRNTAIQTDLRRIYDRILEMCVPILFQGESKRKDKATEKQNKLREILG